MQAAPLLEDRTESDYVEERLLARESSDRRTVIRVEVAMDGDAARLRELNRLFDLASLEVSLSHQGRSFGTRRGCTDACRARARARSLLRRCVPTQPVSAVPRGVRQARRR